MTTKQRNALLAGVLALALPMAFTSCSSDDDETNSEAVTQNVGLYGTFDVGDLRYIVMSDNEVYVTQSDYDYNNIANDKTDGTLPKYGGTYSGNVIIPETVVYNGTTYTITGIDVSAFYGCENLFSITIPNTVTNILGYAFFNCPNLRTVKFGEGVERIEQAAFFECTSLEEITIPESTTYIGNGAFYGCTNLTTLNFNAVACNTSDSTPVFLGCTALANVNIGEKVTEIPNCLFSCYGLDQDSLPLFIYGSKPFSFTEITIPNSVTSIGAEAFYYCENLKTIKIGDGVQTIGGDAFTHCTSLEKFDTGSGVTNIDSYAFRGCTNLVSMTFGVSVQTIGQYIFYGVSNSLSEIYSYNPTPPTIESDIFTGETTSACVLYVPTESVEAYSSADYWKHFSNIVGIQ